jgi:hypothetical protein
MKSIEAKSDVVAARQVRLITLQRAEDLLQDLARGARRRRQMTGSLQRRWVIHCERDAICESGRDECSLAITDGQIQSLLS